MRSGWYNCDFSYVDQGSVSKSVYLRRCHVRVPHLVFLFLISLFVISPVLPQSPNGTVSGIVVDPSGAAIVGAELVIVSDATGVQYTAKTNGEGIYLVPNLPPGTYRLQVS